MLMRTSHSKNKTSRSLNKAGLKEKLVLYGAGASLVALLIGLHLSSVRSTRPERTQAVPLFYESAEAAKPFPATLSPAVFQDPVVAHAYEIAKKSPGLMVQLPCYCWCSRDMGHRSLLDCYTSVHAESCDICIKEALLAETMSRAGRRIDEIRAAIILRDWTTEH